MNKLRLTCDNITTTVTSEREARAWAREQLGASRVKETPTEKGWQLWDVRDTDEMSDNCVTVEVV